MAVCSVDYPGRGPWSSSDDFARLWQLVLLDRHACQRDRARTLTASTPNLKGDLWRDMRDGRPSDRVGRSRRFNGLPKCGKDAKFVPIRSSFGEPRLCLFSP